MYYWHQNKGTITSIGGEHGTNPELSHTLATGVFMTSGQNTRWTLVIERTPNTSIALGEDRSSISTMGESHIEFDWRDDETGLTS